MAAAPPTAAPLAAADVPRLNDKVEKLIDELVHNLRRRKIVGSAELTVQTGKLFLALISTLKPSTLAAVRRRNSLVYDAKQDMVKIVKAVGRRLIEAMPVELSIGNTVRRILHIIRTEYRKNLRPACHTLNSGRNTVPRGIPLVLRFMLHQAKEKGTQETPALYNMLGATHVDLLKPYIIKDEVLGHLKEWIDDMGSLRKNIADQAVDHIHANEVIMTYGASVTVAEFLIAAARKKRKFLVIVAETAPSYQGHQISLKLAQAGIETTLINDAAIFGMMARVNKVIIPCHGVMANGGLIALVGTHMVAQAAKHHSIPLVVCTGLYKLCPLFPGDPDTFNCLNSPAEVLDFDVAEQPTNTPIVHNPGFDYIPPELVSLLITNYQDGGALSPSYVYRLLQDHYDPEDYEL